MKKIILTSVFAILLGIGIYLYSFHVNKNYKEILYTYEYGIKTDNFFAFHNLEIDAIEWIKHHPSDFFKELALINNKANIKLSGWLEFENGKAISAYLYNNEYGSIHLKETNGFTKISIKDKIFFTKAAEYYSKSKNTLPDDIDFSKISYETFINLPPLHYSALRNLDSTKLIKITTPLSINDIFAIKNIATLVNNKWWLNTKSVSIPMD